MPGAWIPLAIRADSMVRYAVVRSLEISYMVIVCDYGRLVCDVEPKDEGSGKFNCMG